MKIGTHPVNIRKRDDSGKVIGSTEVGTATFNIYDSVGEAIQEVGEAKVLELLNAQTRTNALNEKRAESRPGSMSKTAMRNKAIGLLTPEDYMTVAQAGPNAQATLENLIAAKVAEIAASQPTKEDENDD